MYYVYYFNILSVIVLQIRDKQMRETPSEHAMDPELKVVWKKSNTIKEVNKIVNDQLYCFLPL